MQKSLSKLHSKTYDSVADEYERRVEKLKPVTKYCLNQLMKGMKPGSKILDIGCAVGYTIEIFRKAGMIADGIDISPEMIKYAKRRNPDSKLTVGDFMDTEFPNNYYDGVLAFAFIHLFPKDVVTQCIDKIVNILKPSGAFFISTTNSSSSSEGFEQKVGFKDGAKRFRKHWTQDELENLIKSHNLEIIWHEDIKDEFGKIWMDYIVKKR